MGKGNVQLIAGGKVSGAAGETSVGGTNEGKAAVQGMLGAGRSDGGLQGIEASAVEGKTVRKSGLYLLLGDAESRGSGRERSAQRQG